jgi:hypothetical protein
MQVVFIHKCKVYKDAEIDANDTAARRFLDRFAGFGPM